MKRLLVVALVAALALGVSSAVAATAPFRTGAFAEQPAEGYSVPQRQNRIAVNRTTGDVYVADIIRDAVVVYRPSAEGATEVTSFGAGGLTNPFGIAIDQATGDVFVSDDNGVVKYDGDNTTSPAFTPDPDFEGSSATGPLAYDQASDRLLVADVDDDVVRRYTAAGAADGSFDGSAGAGSPGAFAGLQDLAVDSAGDVIVVDSTGDPRRGTGVSRVERFGADGAWKATIGPVAGAATAGVIPDSREVLVSGNQDAVNRNEKPTVHRFAASGRDLGAVLIDDAVRYSTVSGIAAAAGAAPALFIATDVSAGNYVGGYGRTSVQMYAFFELSAPAVQTGAATRLRPDGAQVSGSVNPNRMPTTYWFEYGRTTAYGLSAPATRDLDAGAGSAARAVSRKLSGLEPGAVYHYRIVARNSEGTSTGADRTFTTPVDAPAAGGRAYEQVSPSDKGSYPVFDPRGFSQGPTAVSPDGARVIFQSFGSFAGNTHGAQSTYRSARTPAGWRTESVSPAPTVPPNLSRFHGSVAWGLPTPDLTQSLMLTDSQWDPGDDNFNLLSGGRDGVDLYLRPPSGLPRLQSATADGRAAGRVYGALVTPDGATTTFTTPNHVVPEDADRPDGRTGVYTRSGGTTRLASIMPAGLQGQDCGDAFVPAAQFFENAGTLSSDGRRVVFATYLPGGDGSFGCDFVTVPRLFMRIDGRRTVEVSGSRRAQPDPAGRFGAEFVGAARDGSRVFFLSGEQLTDDAHGGLGASYLYEFRPGADAGSDSLRLAARPDAEGIEAGPRDVVVSRDGRRLFLTDTIRVALLKVDDGGAVERIADVGPAGEITDYSLAPDGRSLLFATSGKPTADDTGGTGQLYLWREGKGVVCVSCSPTGVTSSEPSFPNGAGFRAQSRDYAGALSADGSRVLFTTAEALVASDTNNKPDAYEWHEGRVSLVSSGITADVNLAIGLSANGRDAFFATSQSLVPGDVDGGDLDIYDARIGGGFPAAGGGGDAAPCEGDDCQGARGQLPAWLAPPKIAAPGDPKPPVRPKLAVGSISAAARRAFARTGRLRLLVRVNRAGTVRVSARAKIAKRTPVVARASRRAAKAGRVRLTLRLSRTARRTLSRRRSLSIGLDARFGRAAPVARAFKLRLARRKPAKRRAPGASGQRAERDASRKGARR